MDDEFESEFVTTIGMDFKVDIVKNVHLSSNGDEEISCENSSFLSS